MRFKCINFKLNLFILVIICYTNSYSQSGSVKLEIISSLNNPAIRLGDPGTEDNKYGFEGGTAFKHQGKYQLFTCEIINDPYIVKTRLAHWQSSDGIAWKRVSTLFESTADTTGTDKNATIWSPMPHYNKQEGRWNIFYVSYKSKPNDSTGWYLGYEGRIMRAVSQVKGDKGLSGPYKDAGFVLEPGMNDGPWEGLQGTDSFYGYKVGKMWYAFFGSAQTQKNPNPNYPIWSVGLASAPKLSGPWKKITEINPIKLSDEFAENPIVNKLKDGTYIAMYDGGAENAFGYSTSTDGVHWTKGEYLHLENYCKVWWWRMRTPLGLIPEKDGTFTLYFTAWTEKDGYNRGHVGMAKLKVVK